MCCHLDVPIIVISDMFGVVRSPITGNISPRSVINNPLPLESQKQTSAQARFIGGPIIKKMTSRIYKS